VQLFSIIEQRLLAARRDLPRVPRLSGGRLQFFTRYFHAVENLGRSTLMESLLDATNQAVRQLPASAEQASRLKWLRYCEARLARNMGQPERAEKLLEALREEAGEDVTLQLWVLGQLGSALQAQYKLREAHDCFSRELKLKREKREDLYNLPASHIRLASLHWTLGELAEAEGHYREAIGAAQEKNIQRVDTEAFARLYLGSVLFENGQWELAFDLALEALYLARTALPQDRNLAQSVVGQLMPLIARRDPALLDTLHCEALGLLGAMWPAAEAAGLSLWEPFHFVFRELAALIRRHATTFLGVQELENLLEAWPLESKNVALRDRALPDLAARIRFLQMLRALVDEEVSIAALATLLTVFEERNPRCSELGEIVEHARRACARSCPETSRTETRLLSRLDGKSFLAMPPKTAQALLAAFRAAHDGGVDQVVVVREARLRPFVRRLLAAEFPLVPVLSWPERMDDAPAPTREVEFAPAPAEAAPLPAA
jgi:tetratricopeptide (TPR) repeat protein